MLAKLTDILPTPPLICTEDQKVRNLATSVGVGRFWSALISKRSILSEIYNKIASEDDWPKTESDISSIPSLIFAGCKLGFCLAFEDLRRSGLEKKAIMWNLKPAFGAPTTYLCLLQMW